MSQQNDFEQEFSLIDGQIGDDDQYQFEEIIKQKLDQITDLKQLAKLQTFTDE